MSGAVILCNTAAARREAARRDAEQEHEHEVEAALWRIASGLKDADRRRGGGTVGGWS